MIDKFVEEAFAQADNAIARKVGVVFNAMYDQDRAKIVGTCASLIGVDDYADLLDAVKAKGQEGNLRAFEYVLLAAGFYKGYYAGRQSMLEDISHE